MLDAPVSIHDAKAELLEELRGQLSLISKAASSESESFSSAINSLALLKPLYEHVNQGHHKALCISALERLYELHSGLTWQWNPTNTGRGTEADIEGRTHTRKLVVAAECSAAIDARGTLGERMRRTLEKLAQTEGVRRYYFAATNKLHQSAERRVAKYSLPVVVIRINL